MDVATFNTKQFESSFFFLSGCKSGKLEAFNFEAPVLTYILYLKVILARRYSES